MKLKKGSSLLAAAVFLGGVSSAWAQTAPLVSRDVLINVNSGLVQNQGVLGDGGAPMVVYSTEVSVPLAPWLRLVFDDVLLSGLPEAGNGSYLIITSLKDGHHQRLDAKSLKDWSNTSAYFNGEAVLVELYAHPGTGINRILMSEVTAGDPLGMGPFRNETICGGLDDRTLSMFPQQGRLMPIGCTGWMITTGVCANRFLTAGHCITAATVNAVMQFNVPFSTVGGAPVAPSPSHQYPVLAGQIQSNNGGVGNDYAQFFTGVNSNTGLHAREAQGGAAYALSAAAPAPAGQTLRVTGYGTSAPNDPPPAGGLPLNQSQVQKTHTGLYTNLVGNRIGYQVDTTGGNSGSPVVNGTLPSSLAIGIHTHGGCVNPTGVSENSGTAIQIAGLQGFLAAPLGTCVPYDAPTCLQTLFAQDNQGSAGGAVYFNVTVADSPLEVHSLFTNIVQAAGTSLSNSPSVPGVQVYTTPDTHVGKEGNIALWTKVAEGNGVSAGPNGATLVALENRFILQPFRTYGVAIATSSVAANHYTNGNGLNQQYSNPDLTIDTGSATNVAFGGGAFTPRVWNGRLCYEVLPTNGNCISTLYAANNAGSDGGTVFFNVGVQPGAAIAVSGMRLNTMAAAGTGLDVTVWRTNAGITTHVGHETIAADWTQVAHGTGTSAGLDLQSIITLDSPFNLSGNTNQGIAIILDVAGAAAEGHRYTNGNGSNQIYFDGKVRITAGAATNAAFGPAPPFTPRVWNGTLCYGVGLTACTNTRYEQSPPNASIGGWNSNIAGGIASTQQVADDFIIPAGGVINRMTLWSVYTGDNSIPAATQDFTVRFFADAAGSPGAQLYTANVSAAVQDTGLIHTFFAPDRPILQFDITLPAPFNAAAGTKYWLNPVGNSNGHTWCWQLINNTGTNAVRGTPVAAWIVSAIGDHAFELCGSPLCYPDCNGVGGLTIADFGCFQTRFVAGDPYADCNNTGTLTIADFGCFQTAFVAGCP